MRTLTRRQLGSDTAIAVVFVLACAALMFATGLSGVVSRVHVVPLLFIAAALAFRRLSPPLSLAVAWAGAFVQLASDLDPQVYDIAICAVLFACAAYGGTVVRWLGLASALVGAPIASGYLITRVGWFGGIEAFPTLFPGQLRDFGVLFAGILALLVLSWVSGLLARSLRTTRATSEREEQARRARDLAEYRVVVEQERGRIARDMHDVVAHSLAVVIAQADGARFAAPTRPDVAVDALGTISAVARDALGDVRMLLAELRHDEGSAPQPALSDLEALFAQLRHAGLELRVHESGWRGGLSAGHELAVYRIVQEGLTNALRHGEPGTPVELTMFWADDALHMELVNTVRVAPEPEPSRVGPGPGHGLPGMRERAQLAGGTVTASPEADGRFVVRARIPRAPANASARAAVTA